ncbi:MAG: thioredoxin family protein [Chthoniobacterales bacterium]|nr:thioredoxin family protein [Chthoniobacterales bacterium]
MKTKLLLTALTCVAASFAIADEVKVGSEAPAFTLTDTEGKTHNLADYRGKYVVLEWFNEGCPFVKKHYAGGNMQKLQKEYTGKDVVWLSMNSSAEGEQGHVTPESAKKTMAEWNMEATKILLDHDGKVGQAYGARTTPHMYVIDPEGKLVYQGAIDSKATANAADIESSENYVKVALDNSMAGKPVENTSTKPYGCSVKYKD